MMTGLLPCILWVFIFTPALATVCPTCLNGATCDPDQNICECQRGFYGERCQYRSEQKGCPQADPYVRGGTFDATNTPSGLFLSYRCRSGYVLKGKSIVSCLPSGRWSSPPPVCVEDKPEISTETRKYDTDSKEMVERIAKIEDTVAQLKMISYENMIKEVIEQKIKNEMESKWKNYESKVKQVSENLVDNIKNYEIQLKSLIQRANLYLETSGNFVWEVKNFSHKAKNTNHFSEPFFSHGSFGYKMVLGFEIIQEKFALHVYILKGPWDAMLKWPCHYKMTLVLIDQKGDKNFQSIIEPPQDESQVVDRPTTFNNRGFGRDPFTTMDELKKSFLFNDSIIIKASVKINEF